MYIHLWSYINCVHACIIYMYVYNIFCYYSRLSISTLFVSNKLLCDSLYYNSIDT